MRPGTFRLEFFAPNLLDATEPIQPGWYALVRQQNASYVHLGPFSTRAAVLADVRRAINPTPEQLPGDERFYSDDGTEEHIHGPRSPGGNPSGQQAYDNDARNRLGDEGQSDA